MPAYAITAIDRTGVRCSLREAAPDEAQLRERLRGRQLWPTRIRPVTPSRRLARLTLPPREFISLLHQLELQLKAGLTADVALRQLADDAQGRMKKLLDHLNEAIAQGTPIHEACRFFKKQFPPHLAAVIAAGEASAQLPEALRALAAHVAGVHELRRTARRALIYPALVLGATAGLIAFLLVGVVPQFAAIFSSLNMKLPALTRALIATSTAMREHWPILAGAVPAAVIASIFAARHARLRYLRDAVFLRLPVFGDMLRCLATARFAAHCRLLHEAGIPLLDALATGAELTGNAVLARDLLVARERVTIGTPLYAALPQKHTFPTFFIPALKAGETTGQLSAALHHIEEYATGAAKERLSVVLTLMEPLLLGFLTGVVGLIALSFFLPLITLLGGVNAR